PPPRVSPQGRRPYPPGTAAHSIGSAGPTAGTLHNSEMDGDGIAREFPAAAGSRLAWAELPQHVLEAVEERLGSRVVVAVDRPGGFSPGAAARLRLADGRRPFVKAVASTQNEDSPEMHRSEARIAESMPPEAPVPRFLFEYDDGVWVALGF